MMTTILKKVSLKTFLLGFLILVFPLFASAQSAGIGIKPLKREIYMSPGDTRFMEVEVVNIEDKVLVADPEVQSFTSHDNAGVPVDGVSESDNPQDMVNWINFPMERIEVPAKDSKKITFSITAPEDAEPGGHYGAIFYKAIVKSDKGGVQIRPRVASLLLVQIEGEVKVDGDVNYFGLDEQRLFSDRPISFRTTFENKGNVHLKPIGKIILRDKDGNQIEEISAKRMLGDEEEGLMDYIPVNVNYGNVLPGSERSFINAWDNPYLEDGVTAELSLSYDNFNTEITRTAEVDFEMGAEISDIKFDKENSTFYLSLKNTGDIRIRPQFSMDITNDLDFKVDSLEYDDDHYIQRGEVYEIEIPWGKNPPDGMYTARINFESSYLKDIHPEVTFRIGNDLLASILNSPISWAVVAGLFAVLLAWGLWFRRKEKK